MKALNKYFTVHSVYNATIHFLLGMGVGIILTFPYFGTHPVRWGLGLVAVGIIGHLYPLVLKK